MLLRMNEQSSLNFLALLEESFALLSERRCVREPVAMSIDPCLNERLEP